MKKIISLYSLILIVLALPVGLQAQQTIPARLSTENTSVTKENGTVVLSTHIKTENLHLKSQEMVYITPMLHSADGSQWYQFDPVIVAGRTRYKVLQREIAFNNTHFDRKPLAIIKYNKHNEQVIPVTLSVPYQSWMDNSRFVLHEDLTGCACENEAKETYLVMDPALPVQYVPQFEVAYIVPPREEVKLRSETYAAHINFEVGKHAILPQFKDNAEVLNQVDKIINEIQGDANVNVTGFNITGYASPEGNAQSNLTLSKNRAEAFVLYLTNKYKIVPSQMSVNWKGEDWAGLRDIVANSTMFNKQEVLDIIDNEANVATRKTKLQRVEGGTAYRMMLKDFYPMLRRNEYTIAFSVKNFNLDEAREIMKTKPQYLNQNEMYLVAQSYPVNSPEYKEAFRNIGKYYPEDEVAILNVSAADLKNGDINSTLSKLEKVNRAEAWNNLGIAAFEQKDYVKAEAYFTRASQAGLTTATNNLEELSKFTKSVR